MKIKIEKKQNLNNGRLYEWYTVSNIEAISGRDTRSYEYRGDDIINFIKMKNVDVETGRGIKYINGNAYAPVQVIETNEYEYSDNEDIREEQIKKQGWAEDIESAIYYIVF